jgi:hypothetical protein
MCWFSVFWVQCCGSGSGIRNPGLDAFSTPGSGIRDGRKSASGSGIRDEQPGSYFLELRNHFLPFLGLKYLNSLMRIRDPEWRQFGSGIRDGKKSDPGSGINIPDPQHWLKYFKIPAAVTLHKLKICRLA